jgi:hypothetical protein
LCLLLCPTPIEWGVVTLLPEVEIVLVKAICGHETDEGRVHLSFTVMRTCPVFDALRSMLQLAVLHNEALVLYWGIGLCLVLG